MKHKADIFDIIWPIYAIVVTVCMVCMLGLYAIRTSDDTQSEADIVIKYREDILNVYDFEHYAYTVQECGGKFNVEGEDFMILTFYTADGKYEFACWHKEDDIDWEVLTYEKA